MIRITPAISIGEDELEERFIRASGPGGQNVNKLASAVQLRFDVRRSPSLPDDVRARLERLAGKRLTRAGVLVIAAQRHRTQERNRAGRARAPRRLDPARRGGAGPAPGDQADRRRARAPAAIQEAPRLDQGLAPAKAELRVGPQPLLGSFAHATSCDRRNQSLVSCLTRRVHSTAAAIVNNKEITRGRRRKGPVCLRFGAGATENNNE